MILFGLDLAPPQLRSGALEKHFILRLLQLRKVFGLRNLTISSDIAFIY
jgi:hypothetical protein